MIAHTILLLTSRDIIASFISGMISEIVTDIL